MGSKIGRPTDNPLKVQATVRYDEHCKHILDKYCKQKGIGRNEAIRQGIKKLESELKE
jgi:hypothetical protein